MNNNDFVDTLRATHKLEKIEAGKLVSALFAAIGDAAAAGEEIAMSGLVTVLPAREGRKPVTGATIQIAALNKLTFVAAKAVKDKLNG